MHTIFYTQRQIHCDLLFKNKERLSMYFKIKFKKVKPTPEFIKEAIESYIRLKCLPLKHYEPEVAEVVFK